MSTNRRATDRSTRLGFVGLGVMGRPMVSNLLRAGYPVHVNRISPTSEYLIAEGATPEESPAAVAREADIVIMMLPDTSDVETVLFGPLGVASALRPGAFVIDMSSISPTATVEFAGRVRAVGGKYLDAPVSGGEVGAREGSLAILVGAEAEDLAQCSKMLSVLGRSVSLVGGVGSGQITKIVNQMIVAGTIQIVAEALTLAAKAGVEPSRVREAINGGFAASRVLELHGARMLEHNYEPGFRARLHLKDLTNAAATARSYHLQLPATSVAHEALAEAVRAGWGELDHSVLFRTIENTPKN